MVSRLTVNFSIKVLIKAKAAYGYGDIKKAWASQRFVPWSSRMLPIALRREGVTEPLSVLSSLVPCFLTRHLVDISPLDKDSCTH